MKRLLIFSLLVGIVCSKHLVAYYTNWAQYRQGPAKFVPENIIPIVKSLTQVNYAFAKLDVLGNVIPVEWNDCVQNKWPGCQGYSDTMYDRVLALKSVNPDLKVLISIGGWSWGGTLACPAFSAMANNPSARQNFVQQAAKFVGVFGFDGVDIDWEFPGDIGNGCNAYDTYNYPILMSELRAALRPPLLLTTTIPAGKGDADTMNIPSIVDSVDFMGLMAYDFYGTWSNVSGENAPLYGRNIRHDGNNVADSISLYLDTFGVPASKLVLGLATYGHTFQSPSLGAANAGPGPAGTYTRQAGILAYYEITQLGGTYNFDQATQCPFTTYQGEFLAGYDDRKSLAVKVNYTNSLGLGGAMVWTLDLDEFNNNYPLISQIAASL